MKLWEIVSRAVNASKIFCKTNWPFTTHNTKTLTMDDLGPDLLHLLFHGTMAAIGLNYSGEESSCRTTGIPLFLVASGSLHVISLLVGLVFQQHTGNFSAVPPLLALTSITLGMRAASNSSSMCGWLPTLATQLTLAVQFFLLALDVFRILVSIVLTLVIAAGVVAAAAYTLNITTLLPVPQLTT